MAFGNVMDLSRNKAILVVGATGFLGKVFVKKILRITPNVKKIYLLVRAADSDIHGKDLFRVVRERWGASLYSFISENLIVVPGDVSRKYLGVNDYNLREDIQREIEIAINFAATTNFDKRYDTALPTITYGTLNALLFAKLNIKLFVHVSTVSRISVFGNRTIDSVIIASGQRRLFFFSFDARSILDLIPADVIINTMIVVMVARANQYSEKFIYNVGSLAKNLITTTKVLHYIFHYFTKKPWINKDGKFVSNYVLFQNLHSHLSSTSSEG